MSAIKGGKRALEDRLVGLEERLEKLEAQNHAQNLDIMAVEAWDERIEALEQSVHGGGGYTGKASLSFVEGLLERIEKLETRETNMIRQWMDRIEKLESVPDFTAKLRSAVDDYLDNVKDNLFRRIEKLESHEHHHGCDIDSKLVLELQQRLEKLEQRPAMYHKCDKALEERLGKLEAHSQYNDDVIKHLWNQYREFEAWYQDVQKKLEQVQKLEQAKNASTADVIMAEVMKDMLNRRMADMLPSTRLTREYKGWDEWSNKK